MNKRKALIILVFSSLFLMMVSLFYLLSVSRFAKMGTSVTMIVVTVIVVIVANLINFYTLNVSKKKTDLKKIRLFDQLSDWFSFISLSLACIVTVFVFFLFNSKVRLSSMSPTLESNDNVLVYHFNYQPRKNDITIIYIKRGKYNLPDSTFRNNNNEYEDFVFFVKRIVALEGDLITFSLESDSDGAYFVMYVNNVLQKSVNGEIYKLSDTKEIKSDLDENGYLIKDKVIVLGDNASNSNDSRSFGAVDCSDLLGRVIFRVFPNSGVVR